MIVTYTPEDNPADKQTWDFNPKRLRVSQQTALEEQYHAPWADFYVAVLKDEARARRVLLWYLLTQVHPKLAFRDTPDFYQEELVVEQTSTELADMHDEAVAAVPEHLRGQFEAVFAAQVAEAREREGLSPDPGVVAGELVEGKEIRPRRSSPTGTG